MQVRRSKLTENLRLCPLAAARTQQENSDCLGEACACYVKMHKPRVMQSDRCKLLDPEYFFRYVGCGLIAHIPWELAKREKDQKTQPQPNRSEEIP